jgi:hypothetical protein
MFAAHWPRLSVQMTTSAFKLFIPITKVDVEKREVWGTLTQEIGDSDKEIFDYESSKPLFEAWSDRVSKITDGKSLGAVRAMHQPIAAGKIIAMDFDDSALKIDIGTKIVDDAEWDKCQQGVYTGFSAGGKYVRKWRDPKDKGLTRFTADPYEASLVDWPAVPTAMFEMIKAGGVVEKTAFKAPVLRVDFRKTIGPKLATIAKRLGITFDDATLAKAARASDFAKGLYEVSRLAEMAQSLIWLQQGIVWERDVEGDDSPVPETLATHVEGILATLDEMSTEEVNEAIAQLHASTAKGAAKVSSPSPSTTSSARTTAMSDKFRKIAKKHMDTLNDLTDHANALHKMFGEHAAKCEGTKQGEMAKALSTMMGDHCAKLEGFKEEVGGLPETDPVSDEEHSEKMAKAAGELEKMKKRAETAEAALAAAPGDETLKKALGESKDALTKMTGERDTLATQLEESLTLCDQLLEKKKGTLLSVDRSGDGDDAVTKAAKAKKAREDAAAAGADDSKLTDRERVQKAIRSSLGRPRLDLGFGEPVEINAEG